MIRMDLSELQAFGRDLAAAARQEPGLVEDFVARSGEAILEEIRQRAPKASGGLAESFARQGARASMLGASVSIGTDSPYAAAIEYGQAPTAIPVTPALVQWFASHGFDDAERAAWRFAAKVREQGQPARPFFNDAVDSAEGTVDAELERLADRTMALLGGA